MTQVQLSVKNNQRTMI